MRCYGSHALIARLRNREFVTDSPGRRLERGPDFRFRGFALTQGRVSAMA